MFPELTKGRSQQICRPRCRTRRNVEGQRLGERSYIPGRSSSLNRHAIGPTTRKLGCCRVLQLTLFKESTPLQPHHYCRVLTAKRFSPSQKRHYSPTMYCGCWAFTHWCPFPLGQSRTIKSAHVPMQARHVQHVVRRAVCRTAKLSKPVMKCWGERVNLSASDFVRVVMKLTMTAHRVAWATRRQAQKRARLSTLLNPLQRVGDATPCAQGHRQVQPGRNGTRRD